GAGYSPVPTTGSPPGAPAFHDASFFDAEPTGAALCEGLEQRSQEVAEYALPDAPPAPAGGEVVPGTYVLNELLSYGAAQGDASDDPPPPPMTGALGRATIFVSARYVRVLDAEGSTSDVLPADRARAAAWRVEGTTLTFTTEGGDALEASPFTADGNLLTLFRSPDRVATYRLLR